MAEMTNFDELIDNLVNAGQELENEHEHREIVKKANKRIFEKARRALTDAISAVVAGWDEAMARFDNLLSRANADRV